MRIFGIQFQTPTAVPYGLPRRRRCLPLLGVLLGLVTVTLSGAPKPPLESDYDLPAALAAASDFDGTEKAEQMRKIGNDLFQRGRFTEAVECLSEGSQLAEDAGAIALQSRLQQLIGKTQIRRERFAEALEAAERGRALAFTTDDASLKAEALFILSTAFATLRDFENALQYCQEALSFARGTENPSLEGQILNNIAIVYWQMGDFIHSEDYLRQALDSDPGSDRLRYLLINNIGVALMEQGKLDEAETYLKRAYDHFESHADGYFVALLKSNFADLAERRGRSEEALGLCAEALEMADELNNQYVRVRTYRHQGNALLDLGRVEEAEEAYQHSVEAAGVLRDASEEMQTRGRLIELYEKTGRFEEALAATRAIQTIREEILSRQVRYQSVFLEAQFESTRKEQEIALLNHQRNLAEMAAEREKLEAEKSERELALLRNQREAELTERNLVIASLVIAIFCLVLLYNRFRFQKRAYSHIATQRDEIENNHRELQKANAALHHLNKEKDEILGIAAHDLQTPLVAQRGFAEILHENWRNLSPEEVSELTESIASAADQMSEIIRNLLDSHRLEQGALSVQRQPIDALPRLNAVLAQIGPSARAKHQRLNIDLPTAFPLIDLDPIAFDRIVQNLLSNAVKYSPPASPIHVSAAATADGRFAFAIRDEGPGIPLDEQPQLFTKFARLSNRTTAGEASIGLGLSIVKQLVELQDGVIRCDSVPGQGSTFMVSFPLSAARLDRPRRESAAEVSC